MSHRKCSADHDTLSLYVLSLYVLSLHVLSGVDTHHGNDSLVTTHESRPNPCILFPMKHALASLAGVAASHTGSKIVLTPQGRDPLPPSLRKHHSPFPFPPPPPPTNFVLSVVSASAATASDVAAVAAAAADAAVGAKVTA